MNVLEFSSDGYTEFNSARWLVADKADALNKSGLASVKILNIRHWLYSTIEARRTCDWADIIIIHRVAINDTHKQIEMWRNRGKAVVIAGDDDYIRIDKKNAAFGFWGEGNVTITLSDGHQYQDKMLEHPIAQFTKGLSICTAAISPSELLCNDWSKYGSVFWIPNYIDLDMYQKLFKFGRPTSPERIIIGWGGSLSHVPSFENSGVIPALQQVMAKYSNVYMLIVGDNRVKDIISLPHNRLLYLNYVKWNEWPRLMNNWYDISLVPLAGEYDMRRSWIKPLEATTMGIPFVATKGYPYKEFFGKFDECNAGVFVNQGDIDKGDKPNSAGWQEALEQVVENLYQYKQGAMQADVIPYSLEDNVQHIVDIYQQIIDIN